MLPEPVLGVAEAEVRSTDGVIVGYDDLGLTSGSEGGGASGAAGADATAVLMVGVYYNRISSICRERRRCDCLPLGQGVVGLPDRWRLKGTGSLEDDRA